MRQRSKALFGNADTLEVAVAIAINDEGAVNATDLAVETGIVNTRVRARLVAFAEVGLLVEGPPDRKRWFLRQDDPFWDVCVHLLDEWSHGDG